MKKFISTTRVNNIYSVTYYLEETLGENKLIEEHHFNKKTKLVVAALLPIMILVHFISEGASGFKGENIFRFPKHVTVLDLGNQTADTLIAKRIARWKTT